MQAPPVRDVMALGMFMSQKMLLHHGQLLETVILPELPGFML